MQQLDTSPRKYFPKVYDGVFEIDELSNVEDELFKTALERLNILWRNGYLATCDVSGIERYENMFGIVANPEIETLEFRRSRLVERFSVFPSYTMPWLRVRLDEMLGAGNWSAFVDFAKRELVIETVEAASTTVWTHEVSVTINRIKPANLVFISSPMNAVKVLVNEEVLTSKVQFNYKLGAWALGVKPFAEYTEEEVIKMADAQSIQQAMLDNVARFTATDVAYALINDKYSIPRENFIEAASSGCLARIHYEIPASAELGTITNVKLQDASKNTLAEINVVIDNSSNVRMNHKIRFEEGTNAETA